MLLTEDVVFLQPKKINNEKISEGSTSANTAQGKSFCMFSSKCLTLLYSLPSHLSMAVLVPEAAVMQGSKANYVSPLIHDKPNQKLFHPDCGEEYVNEHTAQDDEQSAMKQSFTQYLFSWVLLSKYPALTSQHPDAPDVQPTTTVTDIPSTSVSLPLPISLEKGTSYVDVIKN